MFRLFFVGQVLTLLQACYSQCFDPKTLIMHNSTDYTAPGLKILNNSNLVLCMIVCTKFKMCLSLDWIPEIKTCQLNTRFTIRDGVGLMTEDGIIHVNREKIPEHLVGDCLNHTCNEDSVCVQGNCVPVFKGFMDCSEILQKDPTRKGQDGVYVIYIENTWREVFCDMTTDEGGWTVIQKREDEEEFYRTWNAYKHGFGNASKSYWLGNDAIYKLTKNKDQELRVELEQFNGSEAHALYSSFSVGNENIH